MTLSLPDPLVPRRADQPELGEDVDHRLSPWGVQRNFERLATALGEALASLPGAGEIRMWAGSSAPDGWALCDGSAVARSTRLFDVIGTTYGAGDGSTTFNLPDLRGRAPVGPDGTALRMPNNDTLGAAGGSSSVTLTVAQIPPHNHDHLAGFGAGSNFRAQLAVNLADFGTGNTVYSLRDTAGNIVAGGQSHENRMPYQVVNFIIKL